MNKGIKFIILSLYLCQSIITSNITLEDPKISNESEVHNECFLIYSDETNSDFYNDANFNLTCLRYSIVNSNKDEEGNNFSFDISYNIHFARLKSSKEGEDGFKEKSEIFEILENNEKGLSIDQFASEIQKKNTSLLLLKEFGFSTNEKISHEINKNDSEEGKTTIKLYPHEDSRLSFKLTIEIMDKDAEGNNKIKLIIEAEFENRKGRASSVQNVKQDFVNEIIEIFESEDSKDKEMFGFKIGVITVDESSDDWKILEEELFKNEEEEDLEMPLPFDETEGEEEVDKELLEEEKPSSPSSSSSSSNSESEESDSSSEKNKKDDDADDDNSIFSGLKDMFDNLSTEIGEKLSKSSSDEETKKPKNSGREEQKEEDDDEDSPFERPDSPNPQNIPNKNISERSSEGEEDSNWDAEIRGLFDDHTEEKGSKIADDEFGDENNESEKVHSEEKSDSISKPGSTSIKRRIENQDGKEMKRIRINNEKEEEDYNSELENLEIDQSKTNLEDSEVSKGILDDLIEKVVPESEDEKEISNPLKSENVPSEEFLKREKSDSEQVIEVTETEEDNDEKGDSNIGNDIKDNLKPEESSPLEISELKNNDGNTITDPSHSEADNGSDFDSSEDEEGGDNLTPMRITTPTLILKEKDREKSNIPPNTPINDDKYHKDSEKTPNVKDLEKALAEIEKNSKDSKKDVIIGDGNESHPLKETKDNFEIIRMEEHLNDDDKTKENNKDEVEKADPSSLGILGSEEVKLGDVNKEKKEESLPPPEKKVDSKNLSTSPPLNKTDEIPTSPESKNSKGKKDETIESKEELVSESDEDEDEDMDITLDGTIIEKVFLENEEKEEKSSKGSKKDSVSADEDEIEKERIEEEMSNLKKNAESHVKEHSSEDETIETNDGAMVTKDSLTSKIPGSKEPKLDDADAKDDFITTPKSDPKSPNLEENNDSKPSSISPPLDETKKKDDSISDSSETKDLEGEKDETIALEEELVLDDGDGNEKFKLKKDIGSGESEVDLSKETKIDDRTEKITDSSSSDISIPKKPKLDDKDEDVELPKLDLKSTSSEKERGFSPMKEDFDSNPLSTLPLSDKTDKGDDSISDPPKSKDLEGKEDETIVLEEELVSGDGDEDGSSSTKTEEKKSELKEDIESGEIPISETKDDKSAKRKVHSDEEIKGDDKTKKIDDDNTKKLKDSPSSDISKGKKPELDNKDEDVELPKLDLGRPSSEKEKEESSPLMKEDVDSKSSSTSSPLVETDEIPASSEIKDLKGKKDKAENSEEELVSESDKDITLDGTIIKDAFVKNEEEEEKEKKSSKDSKKGSISVDEEESEKENKPKTKKVSFRETEGTKLTGIGADVDESESSDSSVEIDFEEKGREEGDSEKKVEKENKEKVEKDGEKAKNKDEEKSKTSESNKDNKSDNEKEKGSSGTGALLLKIFLALFIISLIIVLVFVFSKKLDKQI